ncbi:hypothetical protein Tco_0874727 [Tanacetum coccineum]|uniref:Uncharacterized protein n=1 Tax=Tanacetum coccineum TaxID=301880 RepID=A0ABQ5BQI6_9ASTR
MRLQHRRLYLHLNVSDKQQVQFRRTSLTGFPALCVRSSNADALDSPYLLVLNTGTSQSIQHDMSESDKYSEEEEAETMAETIEQYMSKTRADYGSRVARPKIEDKDNFELKGQFLKELQTNTSSGSDHEECDEHIKYVGGAILSKTAADAKVAIQEMAEYSQKWHNGTSRSRTTETSDGLAAIQAQLKNLRREIKKVNEKVYAAQIGCEQYHNLWDAIVNGDLEEESAPTRETSAPPAPKTAKQLAAKRNQERVKSILLLAIPDEYLLKFHNVTDAKSLWAAIKARFEGNEVSKKMQKNEDINQKFLRSLPSSWNQIALIIRNKPEIDENDIDDLCNNLRVYEDELKRYSGSNSGSPNLAFLSSENTGSTNEVSTTSKDFRVSTVGGINQVPSTPCAHDVAYSFLAQPTTSPQLENEDFQQMDGDDLEELDLRWQVAMLTVRVKKKGHFARECRSGRNQGRRSYGDNGRSNAPTTESSSQALVAQDGLGGYDWSNDFEVEPVNYALMAISSSSSSSSSDSEVQKCSKQCLESFKTLQKNYDTKREKHNKAKLEIKGYEIALESLESRIFGHEKNELAWGEKYEFQNYKLKCREIKIYNLNLELEKVVKERDELKDKIVKWEESTKNLDEILNSQMSARDKTSLGYSTQLNELSSNHETDSENSLSIFDVRSRLDEYTIRNKIIESQTTKLNTKTSETAGKINDANTEKPKLASESVVSNPKINRDKVIIEDWNSDDEEEEYEVQTVRPETQTVKTRYDKSGQNSKKQEISFRKVKACFVCKSIDHLIKDCNFHNKKSQEPKLKNVVNIGQREGKPVWDNTKRVNH